jgi:hypothetical protein
MVPLSNKYKNCFSYHSYIHVISHQVHLIRSGIRTHNFSADRYWLHDHDGHFITIRQYLACNVSSEDKFNNNKNINYKCTVFVVGFVFFRTSVSHYDCNWCYFKVLWRINTKMCLKWYNLLPLNSWFYNY